MDWKARVPSLGSISAETVRRKRRSQYNNDTHPDFELETVDSHYFIQSSFLQLSLKLVISRSGNAYPRMALHVQRYLTWETFYRVQECMRRDDLGAFQQMLSTGEISLDSLNMRGGTLMV